MTKKEAITYGERKKARIQEKLCRDESSYGDHSIYYSEMEFTSAALSALREQEQRRWIPVTERLPEKDDRFMCTYKFNSNSEMQFVGDLYYFASDKHPYWQHESAGVIVTHWMPLPEPPKEG